MSPVLISPGMIRPMKISRLVALTLSLSLVFAACGGDDKKSDSTSSSGSSADVEKVVSDALKAEHAKDGKAFAALFTDAGLEAYDSGTREELTTGKAEGFGEDTVDLLEQKNTKITGTKATTEVEVAASDYNVAQVLYLASFTLVKQDGDWLIDGFDFKGSPAPKSGATVIDVKAQEYAYSVSKNEGSGDIAFAFENVGKEQHEMTLFRAPDGTDVTKAKAALENVDGEDLKNVPDGYEADHVTFADVGQKLDVTFAEDLEPGTYFMVCYIPQGGFGENGPVNPEGKPHVQLGMISPFTVK